MDAAYAGVAAICPEYRHMNAGLHLAHSFSTNAHKWLLTTFDCCCLWVADAEPLKAALSLTPVFLRAKGNEWDYKVRAWSSCAAGRLALPGSSGRHVI